MAIDAVTSLVENTQQQSLPFQDIGDSDYKGFICWMTHTLIEFTSPTLVKGCIRNGATLFILNNLKQ